MEKARLPALDASHCINHSPHVVILGAGATRACIPKGDANGRIAPVMADLVSLVGLETTLDRSGVTWRGRDFEGVYDALFRKPRSSVILKEVETRIWDYFAAFEIPSAPTVYDYLLLSLRDKDLVATFNWDPLLIQAYRRHLGIRRLPSVVFLHGNVGIGVCRACHVKGYLGEACRRCRKTFEPTRLLYPVRDKDYTADDFIKSEWAELRAFLGSAYFLTLFGYSAPLTDVAAMSLLRDTWSENATKTLAEVEIIDIKPKADLLETWGSFITRQHYGTKRTFTKSYLSWHPRRSCEALALATLQNDPWPDNWFPEFATLGELQDWVLALVGEEDAFEMARTPLTRHGQPCR